MNRMKRESVVAVTVGYLKENSYSTVSYLVENRWMTNFAICWSKESHNVNAADNKYLHLFVKVG